MKRAILVLLACLAGWLNGNAQTLNFGIKAGSTGSDFSRAVYTDASNNIYQVVFFFNTLTIDSAGTPKTYVSAGNKDVAVIKYNCNRVFQWIIRVGGNGNDGGTFNNSGVVVDSAGNVYFHTTITGNVNIISANGNTQVRSSFGTTDGILLKANSSGIVSWVTQQGGTGNDESGGIAIDRTQSVYVVGFFSNTANFTQTAGGPSAFLSFGSNDIYLVKYSPLGVIDYAQRGGGTLQDNAIGVAVDSSLNAYVAGGWGCCGNTFANFGNNINNAGGWGAYIAKADPTGNWLWANSAGSNNGEANADVVVDDINDRVYTIGHFNGTTSMSSRPPGAAINLTTNGSYDVMVSSFDLNGSLQWVRTFGGIGNEYGYGVSLDPEMNVVGVGEYSSSTNFGSNTLTATGTNSAFYTKYGMTNVPKGAIKIGDGSSATLWDVHHSASGLMYLSGYFKDSVIAGTDTLRSIGSDDAMMVGFQSNDSTIIRASHTALNCLGDTALLEVSNKEIGNFQWFRNDTLWTVSAGNRIRTSAPGTYKAVSINNCAVADTSNAIVITRSPFFTTNVIGDMRICSGDSGRFNATGGTSYRWSPALGLSDTAVANPYVKPGFSSTYVLRITNGTCTAFDTSVVTINTNCCLTCATPLSLNSGVVACYSFTGNSKDESGNGNDATVFNAALAQDRFGINNRAYQFNGFSSYLEVPSSASLQSPTTNISFAFWANFTNWNFSGGVQWNPVVSKSTAATSAQYRGMIRSNGAIAMANTKAFDGAAGSVTNTNTWYYFVISVSNDTLYYYRNGVLLGTITGPTAYVLNNTTPLRIGRNDVNSTSYMTGRLDELRIYNNTLTAAQVRALYQLSAINGLPTISAGVDKNICKGDSVQLTTTGANGTWLWNPSTKLSSDTARSPWSNSDSTRDYVVRVNYNGCLNYDTVKVNVTNFTPSAGVDQTICYGDTAQIIVAGGGNTFAWSPNYRITSLNNDTTKVYPIADTNYIVVSNNGLCNRSDTVRITVNRATLSAGPDKNICQHDTARFTITTNGTVRWSPFKWLSDSVGTSVYSLADSSITYYLSANYLGCQAYDTVFVSVANMPIDAGTNKQVCLGDSVQLQATGGANYIWLPTYQISDTSIANPWVKPLVPTYYYVVAYNSLCARYDSVFVDVKRAQASLGADKTICDGDSIRLLATVLGGYTWNPKTSLSDTGLAPYAKPLVTTDYILTANNFGCMAYDTVKVTVQNFQINAGTDQLICRGDSIQLNATGSPKFNWLPVYNISDTGVANPWVKPLGPTTYFAIATNGYCVRVDTIFIDVKSVSGTAGKDTSMCEGYSVNLDASGGSAYEWITKYNLSDYYIPNPVATPATDFNYVVKISDASSGCSYYDTVFVKVDKWPSVSAGSDKAICPGDFVTLDGTVSAGVQFFTWLPGTGLNDQLLVQPIASPASDTYYTLFAKNGYCYAKDTVFVHVMPKITANFNPTPNNGLAPLPVFFQNLSVNGNTYAWDFGDGLGTSTDKEPNYVYISDGIFRASLKVTDSLGCMDTTSALINVIVKETLFIPSAFTPNGDGLNDIFAVIYSPSRFEFVEMSVYNRWGVKVFDTKLPGGNWWDGKVNGVAEPPGIFTYNVVARDKKGKSYELNGTIALVR